MPTAKDVQTLRAFSAFARRRRVFIGLNKHEVAARAGISYKHYFNIEQGLSAPSLLAYVALCRALGAGRLPLIDGKPSTTPP